MFDLKAIHIPKIKKTLQQKFLENIKSGIVVGMVNLPMCISFAVASGTYPEIGVLSGIWGGAFGGIMGGSYYNVLGPAGALCGFLASFVSVWGAEALPRCALFTGIFAWLIFYFDFGKYIDTLPIAVNEGFTLGVACSIFFGQLGNALGIKIPKHQGASEQTVVDLIAINIYHANEANMNIFGVFILFLLFLIIMSRIMPKVPWIVIVNIAGIILGYLDYIGLTSFNLTLLTHKFDLKFSIFSLPRIPKEHPYMLIDPSFYISCLPIAFVVVLECLISGKIGDTITNTKFNIPRELKGLLITNIIVGIFGGFSSTAALQRTALNIRSGATHKYSSLISSIVLFFMSLIFMPLFKYLPITVIASQMCFVSIRMVNYDEVSDLWHEDRKNFNLFIFVFVVSIISDPIIGVFCGLLIFQLIFSEQLLNPYSEVITTEDVILQGRHQKSNIKEHFRDIPVKEGKYIIYRFVGVINFMNIGVHKERILSLSKNDDSTICLSLRYLNISDINAVEALRALIDEIENNTVKHKIPKNYREEFIENGEVVKLDIEIEIGDMEVENNYLGRKIIITGITQSKFNKFKNFHWFKHLKDRGQLLISDDIKMDV